MKNKLKQFRVEAGLTQAKLAQKVGVTQPNYQRWESGAAPIPEDKLKRLAKNLKTTTDALLGRHPPIEARLYDDSAGAHLSYYGEVAFHFVGGGASLLLSISDKAFDDLYRDLQLRGMFVAVKSLANQTVLIRTKSIADVYFSSEAYDDYGPEHGTYDDHIELQMPDSRDWEIVEALEHGSGLEDFSEADIERVQGRIMITDDQYLELVADGRIKAENLETEKNKNQQETDKIFKLASQTIYQFSNGKKREVYLYDEEELYSVFSDLVDFGDDLGNEMILLPVEGAHRTIFINRDSLDYISIPTHKFELGSIESASADLESFGED